MKIFIVFLAFLLVFSSFLVYKTDSSNYLALQRQLKAFAEEAARGGALMKDETSSVQKGCFVIDFSAANSYGEFIEQSINNKNIKASIAPLYNGTVKIELVKISDQKIKATATWAPTNGYKLFRLPFLYDETGIAENFVSMSAVYCWE